MATFAISWLLLYVKMLFFFYICLLKTVFGVHTHDLKDPKHNGMINSNMSLNPAGEKPI